MVQIHQLWIEHKNAHYASALFRYFKKLAVIFSDFNWLVFLNNKYHCKVRKLGFSVAAVDRGKSVLVFQKKSFIVVNHDFIKTGLISSITMLCNISFNIKVYFIMGKLILN